MLNINQVEHPVRFLSNKYDDLRVQMKRIESKNETLQQRINFYDLKFNDVQMISTT
mgnify:CR=1 FL=1